MSHLPKSIMDCFDKSYDLVYVEYNDRIEDHKFGELLDAIRTQDYYPLDGLIDEWVYDSQGYGVDYAIAELKKDIARQLNIDDKDDLTPDERIDNFVDKHYDLIRDVILDRDKSTPLDDLLAHTQNVVMFYDTGEEVSEYDDIKASRQTVKRALKIKGHDYDKEIDSLIVNAGYGGRIVVYFLADADDMMKIGEANRIKFTNPEVAIIDTVNGSGSNEYFKGHTFTLSYAPDNLFIDKLIKYNYTYAVCGMRGGWCDGTMIKFYTRKTRQNSPSESSLNSEMDREARYKAVFASGKCAAGDMDIKRHRDTYYLNEFPCGTHCPHCGAFWID